MKELLGKNLGNYHLMRMLGKGRMGVVYLAQDRALLRPTALKVLAWTLDNTTSKDPVQWFLSEARSVARISHPNVVQIYNIAKHGEYRFIAMEYVEGASVEQTLLKNGRMNPKKATDLVIQIAAGLEAAHQCGVIHRDIKPANLLMRTDGVVKLSDFGMALNNYTDTLLSAAMRVGTPYFNAPETWEGRPASPASDLYALGVTYFLLLTGRLPFEAKNMHELQWKHIHEPIPDPREYVPDLPDQCRTLIDKCLAKKPHRRCASAKGLGDLAREILSSLRSGQKARVYQTSHPSSIAPPPRVGFESATDKWTTELHFSINPFGAVDPLNAPFSAEPFRSASTKIDTALNAQTKAILVHGPCGTGRTTVCRRHALQSREKRTIFLTINDEKPASTLIERLYQHADLDADPSQEKGLLRFLESAHESGAQSGTIVYVDEVHDPQSPAFAELLRLISLADDSALIIITDTENADHFLKQVPEGMGTLVPIRPLEPREVIDYIRSWLGTALLPVAHLLFFSTDAALLVAHFSEGILTHINTIVRNILKTYSSQNRRVISSFEVWQACTSPHLEPSKQPAHWPPEGVTAIINQYRSKLGIEPVRLASKMPKKKTIEGGTV